MKFVSSCNEYQLKCLHISVARICVFLMRIKTEPSFSRNSLNEDCFSLQVDREHLSLRIFILLLFARLRHIKTRGQ